MKTVHEVSMLSGVSIRALQYYDRIGLLRPTARSDAGYRLYGEADLVRLQEILLFRELEFPLKEIREILDRPGYDRRRALEQQIGLLTLKKERLENLIRHAVALKEKGETTMDFTAFDKSKIDAYAKEAKARWGDTAAYKEYEKRTAGESPEARQSAADGLMAIFAEFGKLKERPASDPEVQKQVRELKDYITGHFYTCTDEILAGLGNLYAAGGEFTENIDRAGGEGTAAFVNESIGRYIR
ncbi:MAG: MerR family transcriptional regulator [Clostridia bacterium]|nr:MerR family transcriptional regulator [Clostridia bacterium]